MTQRRALRIYSASRNRPLLAHNVTHETEIAAPTDKGAESFCAPEGATAVIVLADGTIFWGRGIGAATRAVGEVCFNTSITGYQEIMTDPSYAGQIITFTFPHIGNVGTNPEDIETITPAARGCILRADITEPANWRATQHLDAWLKSYNLPGISGIDTRRLTRKIRDCGAPTGVIFHAPDGQFDIPALIAEAKAYGADLVVAYHPPIFKALSRLDAEDATQRRVLAALAAGFVVYSPHTALDAAAGGLADWLIEGALGSDMPE